MLAISIFLISVMLASHVSATTIAHRSIHQLLTRQSTFDPNEIPAVCSNRCTNLVSTINACTTSTNPACGCSLVDEGSDVDCLNCILYSNGVPPASSIQSVQSFVDQYVEACQSAGVLLPVTTISGGVSGIITTAAGNSFTSVDDPTLTSATGADIPTQASSTAVNHQTVTADPAETSASGNGGLSGLNSNDASRTRGRETAGAAAAVAAALVVFF